MQFTTIVQLHGTSATGLVVPPETVEALGAGKRPAVNVTIGDYRYRSTVAVMGGQFLIPLSAEHRTGAGVTAGDEIEVGIELDTAPRQVTVPADLATALAAVPEVSAAFAALSYSNQSRHVLSVEGAKTAETRERRIAKVVDGLTPA